MDVFFVLSGFLIGQVLLRELEMTDKINKRRFLLNRFLRIFPILLVYVLFRVICHQDYSALYDLVFVNNIVGPKSHIWSVAVEF